MTDLAAVPAPERPEPSVKLDRDCRESLLATEVANQSADGFRVQSQTGTTATLIKGKPVNHKLHAVLSVFTLGVWLIVWLIVYATGGEKRKMVKVDDYGNVTVTDP